MVIYCYLICVRIFLISCSVGSIYSIEVTAWACLRAPSFSRITNWSAAPVDSVVHGSSLTIGSKMDEFDLLGGKDISFDVKLEAQDPTSLDIDEFLYL